MKYNLLKSTPEEGYESWFTASWDHPSQTVKADRGGGETIKRHMFSFSDPQPCKH